MGTVSQALYYRWRSMQHVGEAKPSLSVRARRGLIDHDYQEFTDLSGQSGVDFMTIVGGNNTTPWQGFWRPTGDWVSLPNILSVKYSKNLQQNGVGSATIVIDNIVFKAIAGAFGAYHAIMRGYISPWMGQRILGRLPLNQQNEWFDVLNGGYQIDVSEGYGDQLARTWTGLIEDVDMVTKPDQITVTARDFGVLFTDQRIMGWNHAREIRSPITVADRKRTLGETVVSGGAEASSEAPNHSATNITAPNNSVDWVSDGHTTPGNTEWCEIHVPAGHYEDFYVRPAYNNMEVYLSIYAHGDSCMIDGQPIPEGWVDTGRGLVPGAAGGEPYVKHWASMSDDGAKLSLGHRFDLGDNSVIRVSFRNLSLRAEWNYTYRAAVDRLAAYRFDRTPDISSLQNKRGWILVDDPSDAIRVACLWCGFKEWEIENFGWPLKLPMKWEMSKFFIDMVADIQAQGDTVFFMQSPTPVDTSLGVPTFRSPRQFTPPPNPMLEVRDTDLIEQVEIKWDQSNLPYIIRYRGDIDPNGRTNDQDTSKRYQYEYFPPWSGASRSFPLLPGRVSGVRRHATATDHLLTSTEECHYAALLLARQYGLQEVTGTFKVPGYPGFELDMQASLIDVATGTNSRMWINSIDSEHTTGQDGGWQMTIGGVMLDTEDMQALAADFAATAPAARQERLLSGN